MKKVADFFVMQNISSNIYLKLTEGRTRLASITSRFHIHFLPVLTSYDLRAKDCLQHLASIDSSLALTIIDLHPILTIRNLHV
jgi:hypothetical protein